MTHINYTKINRLLLYFLISFFLHNIISTLICNDTTVMQPIELNNDISLLAGDVIHFRLRVNNKAQVLGVSTKNLVTSSPCSLIPLTPQSKTSQSSQFMVIPVAVINPATLTSSSSTSSLSQLLSTISSNTPSSLVSTSQFIHVISGRLLGVLRCSSKTKLLSSSAYQTYQNKEMILEYYTKYCDNDNSPRPVLLPSSYEAGTCPWKIAYFDTIWDLEIISTTSSTILEVDELALSFQLSSSSSSSSTSSSSSSSTSSSTSEETSSDTTSNTNSSNINQTDSEIEIVNEEMKDTSRYFDIGTGVSSSTGFLPRTPFSINKSPTHTISTLSSSSISQSQLLSQSSQQTPIASSILSQVPLTNLTSKTLSPKTPIQFFSNIDDNNSNNDNIISSSSSINDIDNNNNNKHDIIAGSLYYDPYKAPLYRPSSVWNRVQRRVQTKLKKARNALHIMNQPAAMNTSTVSLDNNQNVSKTQEFQSSMNQKHGIKTLSDTSTSFGSASSILTDTGNVVNTIHNIANGNMSGLFDSVTSSMLNSSSSSSSSSLLDSGLTQLSANSLVDPIAAIVQADPTTFGGPVDVILSSGQATLMTAQNEAILTEQLAESPEISALLGGVDTPGNSSSDSSAPEAYLIIRTRPIEFLQDAIYSLLMPCNGAISLINSEISDDTDEQNVINTTIAAQMQRYEDLLTALLLERDQPMGNIEISDTAILATIGTLFPSYRGIILNQLIDQIYDVPASLRADLIDISPALDININVPTFDGDFPDESEIDKRLEGLQWRLAWSVTPPHDNTTGWMAPLPIWQQQTTPWSKRYLQDERNVPLQLYQQLMMRWDKQLGRWLQTDVVKPPVMEMEELSDNTIFVRRMYERSMVDNFDGMLSGDGIGVWISQGSAQQGPQWLTHPYSPVSRQQTTSHVVFSVLNNKDNNNTNKHNNNDNSDDNMYDNNYNNYYSESNNPQFDSNNPQFDNNNQYSIKDSQEIIKNILTKLNSIIVQQNNPITIDSFYNKKISPYIKSTSVLNNNLKDNKSVKDVILFSISHILNYDVNIFNIHQMNQTVSFDKINFQLILSTIAYDKELLNTTYNIVNQTNINDSNFINNKTNVQHQIFFHVRSLVYALMYIENIISHLQADLLLYTISTEDFLKQVEKNQSSFDPEFHKFFTHSAPVTPAIPITQQSIKKSSFYSAKETDVSQSTPLIHQGKSSLQQFRILSQKLSSSHKKFALHQHKPQRYLNQKKAINQLYDDVHSSSLFSSSSLGSSSQLLSSSSSSLSHKKFTLLNPKVPKPFMQVQQHVPETRFIGQVQPQNILSQHQFDDNIEENVNNDQFDVYQSTLRNHKTFNHNVYGTYNISVNTPISSNKNIHSGNSIQPKRTFNGIIGQKSQYEYIFNNIYELTQRGIFTIQATVQNNIIFKTFKSVFFENIYYKEDNNNNNNNILDNTNTIDTSHNKFSTFSQEINSKSLEEKKENILNKPAFINTKNDSNPYKIIYDVLLNSKLPPHLILDDTVLSSISEHCVNKYQHMIDILYFKYIKAIEPHIISLFTILNHKNSQIGPKLNIDFQKEVHIFLKNTTNNGVINNNTNIMTSFSNNQPTTHQTTTTTIIKTSKGVTKIQSVAQSKHKISPLDVSSSSSSSSSSVFTCTLSSNSNGEIICDSSSTTTTTTASAKATSSTKTFSTTQSSSNKQHLHDLIALLSVQNSPFIQSKKSSKISSRYSGHTTKTLQTEDLDSLSSSSDPSILGLTREVSPSLGDIPITSLFLTESMSNLQYNTDYASINTFPFVLSQHGIRNASPFEQFISAKASKRVFTSSTFSWSIAIQPLWSIVFTDLAVSLSPLQSALQALVLNPVTSLLSSLLGVTLPALPTINLINPNTTLSISQLSFATPITWAISRTVTEDSEVVATFSITSPPQSHLMGRAVALVGRSAVPFTLEVTRSVHIPAGVLGTTEGQLIEFDYSVPGVYDGANLLNSEYMIDMV